MTLGKEKQRKELGQGMTEYLIIVALMAISAIAVMRVTSNRMKAAFGSVAEALKGDERDFDTEEVNDTDVEGKDLDSFNEGVSAD